MLGRNVRVKRRNLGWTQEELAENARLDRTYVSQIERANVNPSLETIARIAFALQVPASELLAPPR